MANDFLTTYAPLANDIATQTGIDPSVVLGIVDIETGGGKHVLGNNIFGISPGGKVAQYRDVQTASQAFVDLMKTPRYAGVTTAADPAGQAAALVKSGYNTVNPNYARLVTGSALNIGKQLGYQTAAPAPPAATEQAKAPPSAKDAVLADPALATSETTPQPTASPTEAAKPPPSVKDQLLADPALQPAAEKPEEPPYGVSPNKYAPDDIAPDPRVSKAFSSIANMRNALEPEPGYVRAGPLPFAVKETTPGSGEMDPKSGWAGARFDPLAPVSTLVNPLLDLLEGTGLSDQGANSPLAGTVSPAATMLLLGSKLGSPVQQFRNPLKMVAEGGDIRFGPPETRPPSAGDMRAAPLPADFKAAPMTPEAAVVAREATAAPPEAATSTPTGMPATPPPEPPSPGARSAGAAATPSYEAIHTPAEEAAYRANAEGQKLLEPQKIGEPDLNQYIPGETVNNAEREQTVKTARELKELGIRVPEALQIDKEAAESNNTARTIYARNTSKGPVEIANRTAQRETDINTDKSTVFAPENIKGPVDFEPVIKHMEGVLDDPFNRQNSDLKAAYKPLLERIREGGIEDPREAWSLIRDIDKMTGKRARSDDRHLHEVAHDLNEVSRLIGDQVDKAAPGFADMRARYAEHSRAIDEMTVLQDMFDKVRGTGQRFTYNDFQRFMKNVVDSRMTPTTDLNAFKAISEENMTRLWNLRDSLRRSASAKELAQAAGSDTMPNIIDALKAVGKMGGTAALHAYAGAHLGPGGNLALQSLIGVGKSLNDRRMINRATRQMNQLMNPREPLRPPPGQENPLTGAPP